MFFNDGVRRIGEHHTHYTNPDHFCLLKANGITDCVAVHDKQNLTCHLIKLASLALLLLTFCIHVSRGCVGVWRDGGREGWVIADWNYNGQFTTTGRVTFKSIYSQFTSGL